LAVANLRGVRCGDRRIVGCAVEIRIAGRTCDDGLRDRTIGREIHFDVDDAGAMVFRKILFGSDRPYERQHVRWSVRDRAR
jgi:hypothetical protein